MQTKSTERSTNWRGMENARPVRVSRFVLIAFSGLRLSLLSQHPFSTHRMFPPLSTLLCSYPTLPLSHPPHSVSVTSQSLRRSLRNHAWFWQLHSRITCRVGKTALGGKLRVPLSSGNLLGIPYLVILLAMHQNSPSLLQPLVTSIQCLTVQHLHPTVWDITEPTNFRTYIF